MEGTGVTVAMEGTAAMAAMVAITARDTMVGGIMGMAITMGTTMDTMAIIVDTMDTGMEDGGTRGLG